MHSMLEGAIDGGILECLFLSWQEDQGRVSSSSWHHNLFTDKQPVCHQEHSKGLTYITRMHPDTLAILVAFEHAECTQEVYGLCVQWSVSMYK